MDTKQLSIVLPDLWGVENMGQGKTDRPIGKSLKLC